MDRIRLILLIALTAFYHTMQAQGSSNEPPVLTATGDQLYCSGSPAFIVTDMSITDPDDTATLAVYIQISEGYVPAQDLLSLTGSHLNVISNWDSTAGKLTLKSPGAGPVPYTDFISAIEAVVYTNNSSAASGSRTFSITIGSANFLPSTGHYYQFVPSLGITWSAARTMAAASTYYGLEGYLATIGSADEAQLSGEQASGAGWIGGSDEASEGIWKWMTGPEAGTVFWNGAVGGSTPNFAFWNTDEPNNLGEEHYAHVTAPGVGIPGSWNDLTLAGGSSGDYQPKGYIVEYGGMPGDPVLNISTSSKLTIPKITSHTASSNCGPGSLQLSATANAGAVKWYDSATAGTLLFTGPTFTTPLLTFTTTYYADASEVGCLTATRTAVTATIHQIPVVSVVTPAAACEGSFQLEATATAGQIRWYAGAGDDETPLGTGDTFTTPVLSETTTFYADAINNGCISAAKVPVTVVVSPKPLVQDEMVSICLGETAELDAGINDVTYAWSGSSVMTRKLTVSAAGTYSVVVTNADGCSATKTFTVTGYSAPIISNIDVDGTTVTINMAVPGDFVYSVDGVNFQESNIFTVADAGLHMATVRENHECGEVNQEFIVIVVPLFFSPNGDGQNDLWSVHGMFFLPEARAAIFDRHGKLLSEVNRGNPSWDGSYNGIALPSGDYWYIFKMGGTAATVRGHFSLVR